MKALCWYGYHDVRVETVPDPAIINPHDAIVKVTSTAICGSDLHLYDGVIPGMQPGDILGHEFMGEIDPSFIVTHRMNLDEAAQGYSTFKTDQNECIKVVLQP